MPIDQLQVAVVDVAAGVALLRVVERAGEQGEEIAGGLEQAPRRKRMLRGQDLGGRHQCRLVAIFDGDDWRLRARQWSCPSPRRPAAGDAWTTIS